MDSDGVDRRGFLRCMGWAGTAVVWTVAAGIPRSGLVGRAAAAEGGLTFAQLSDSHIGFDRPANHDVVGTLQDAVRRVGAAPERPAFLIHTGDITHLSKPDQFDTAAQVIGTAGLDAHYVPGEHDVLEEDGGSFLDRYGKGTQGQGWYSFDQAGVHFVGLVNVVDLKAGGMGNLGREQLDWLERDLAGRAASTPVVVFAHIPLWVVYADWGWGTTDGAEALTHLRRFGSVTVLNGHIHQVMQKVEGHVAFHTAMSTAFPQPAPGTAPSPGPKTVPPGELRSLLGTTRVSFVRGDAPLAVIDTPLAG